MDERTFRQLWWALFGIGIVISLVMVWRSQLGGDQFNILIRGWYLAFADEWKHLGMPTSAGGLSPGGLLALLVGLPLKLWPDDRAATAFIWIISVAGYLVLDRLVGRTLGPTGRLAFAIFYWLNPWRLQNTNYMFALGAAHAWCAYAMRNRRAFWPTVVMVLLPSLGFQIHSSAMVFAFASVLLWWRGVVKVNWWAVGVGFLVTVASYAPWLVTVVGRPDLIPGGTGFPFKNLLTVLPFLKGLIYLLRYPSMALPGRVYELDLAPGSALDDPVSAALSVVFVAMGWASVLLAVAAYRKLVKSLRRLLGRRDWTVSDRLWLRGYVVWTLAGAVFSFALSPAAVTFWQGFPVFHAAAMVMVFHLVALLRSPSAGRALRLAVCWLGVSVFVSVVIALGSPMYRPHRLVDGHDPGGGHVQKVATDHPMYRDLGLYERLDLEVVEEGGYVPDLLRESPNPEP
jgi:hypothetical protein